MKEHVRISTPRENLWAGVMTFTIYLSPAVTSAVLCLQQFQKNVKSVNGGKDFDQSMLEEIYNAIHKEEIVLPEERTGLVKEIYTWKVTTCL